MSDCKFQQVLGRSMVIGKVTNVARMGNDKALKERQGGNGVNAVGLMVGGGCP